MKKPKPRRPSAQPVAEVKPIDWTWLYAPVSWLLIGFAGWTTYSNSFDGLLFFDDLSSIGGNPYLQVLVNPHYWEPERIWTKDGIVQAFKADIDTPFAGRPMVSFTFALNHWWASSLHPSHLPNDYRVLPPHIWFYHFVNLMFHIAVGLLLFQLLRRTFRAPNIREYAGRYANLWATIVALIWIVHPLNTETVDYVTQRTEQVVSLFLMMTIYFGSRSIRSRVPVLWMTLSVIACALGMASKENMVAAPLLMVAYDRAFYFGTWRETFEKRWPFYIPLFLTLGVLLYINVFMFEESGPRGMSVGFGFERMDSLEYLVTQCWAIPRYLRLTLIPIGLCVDYGRLPILNLFFLGWDVSGVLGAVILLSLLGLTIWGWFRHPWIGFLGTWFFFLLAPTSSFVPIVTEVGAERRMYMPLIAVLIAIGAALAVPLQRLVRGECRPLNTERLLICLGALVVLTFVWVIWFYFLMEFREGESLPIWFPLLAVALLSASSIMVLLRNYSAAIKGGSASDKPGTAGITAICAAAQFAALVLAVTSYVRNMDYKQNSTLYGHIPKVFPWNERGCNNYAKICIDENRIEEAEVLLNQALKIDPEYSDAFTNRGIIFHRREQMDRAIQNATEAIRWNPLNASAWNNRGNAFISLKQFDNAVADFSKLIEMNPYSVEGYYGRANAYYLWGKLDEALADINNVISRNPNDFKAYNTKGNILKQMGQNDRAVQAFSLGIDMMIRAGESERHPAIPFVRQCLNLDFRNHAQALTFAPARQTLATILGNRADAYRNLAEKDPGSNARKLMFDDLQKAIAMHPENPMYQVARAEQNFNQKAFPQAFQEFDRVTKSHPTYFPAIRGKLMTAVELKDWTAVFDTVRYLQENGVQIDPALLEKWRADAARDAELQKTNPAPAAQPAGATPQPQPMPNPAAGPAAPTVNPPAPAPPTPSPTGPLPIGPQR